MMADVMHEFIGRFDVTIAGHAVRTFCAALGLPPEDVPLAYPVTFLTRDDIAAALGRGISRDRLLIHQSQSFIRHVPLQLDQSCSLELVRRHREERALAMIIDGKLTDPAGRLLQEFTTTLILKDPHDHFAP